ncbi:MAG TPA: hypothetical protein VGB64_02140 [Actinomycetota bacterium]
MARISFRITILAVALAMLATLAGSPVSAGVGIHTTTGTAVGIGGTVTVNASEPGVGTVTVNGTTFVVTCMYVSSFQIAPGGTHDIFISAVDFSPTGSTFGNTVFIRILDYQVGTDRLGFNFVGLTYNIACDADQDVYPVLSGGFTTTP